MARYDENEGSKSVRLSTYCRESCLVEPDHVEAKSVTDYPIRSSVAVLVKEERFNVRMAKKILIFSISSSIGYLPYITPLPFRLSTFLTLLFPFLFALLLFSFPSFPIQQFSWSLSVDNS